VLSIVQLIVDAAATILGGVLLLRFWMQAIRVRAPVAVGQFIFTLTDWLVRPLRRVLPGVGGYDWASLFGAFLVVLLASSLFFFHGLDGLGVLQMALYRFLTWILYGFMALLIIEAVFSWINPNAPLAPFVRALNEPILGPLRRVVPLLGGLDLSLLVALILLQIAKIILEMLFGFR
jgi:YggT family protein